MPKINSELADQLDALRDSTGEQRGAVVSESLLSAVIAALRGKPAPPSPARA